MLAAAPELLIAADVNAVPPAGIAGVKVNADAEPLPQGKALGIGPLAIGDVKYKTEFGLFKTHDRGRKNRRLDFQDAFAFARDIAK